ncbi:MAG: glycerate kinase [Candidatus Geothermarchaeales archaeon]
MRGITIQNKKALIEKASTSRDREARIITLNAIEDALNASDPRKIIRRSVKLQDDDLTVGDLTLDLRGKKVFIVGGGKGSGAMAEALEEILADRIKRGIINVVKGTKGAFKTQRITLNEGSHPIPNHRGWEGTRWMMQIAREAGEGDILICLISGGGSALMPLPKEGITLEDVQRINEDLLRSGASINEINAVRKHLSDFKGGQLAREAHPARIVSLILSDVVGDPLDVIASGPTAPDPTTFSEAVGILKAYNMWKGAPEAVKRTLLRGERGEIPETPKPGDGVFENVSNLVVGNNRMVVQAARESLMREGLRALLLSSFIEGEARHVGRVFGSIAREEANFDAPLPKPAAVVAGGETTVTVTGGGRGGRNQELVLSACEKMAGLDGVALASVGTDGLDGFTDAAGAIADGKTFLKAREEGVNPLEYLRNNDSYSFFRSVGGLIMTGPTATNLNDLMVLTAL